MNILIFFELIPKGAYCKLNYSNLGKNCAWGRRRTDAKVGKLIEMCEAAWSIKSFWNMSGKLKNGPTCGEAEIENAFWNYNCLVDL